jgi:hypothetical protein
MVDAAVAAASAIEAVSTPDLNSASRSSSSNNNSNSSSSSSSSSSVQLMTRATYRHGLSRVLQFHRLCLGLVSSYLVSRLGDSISF